MNVQEFPECCGITIFANFGNTTIARNTTNYTKEDVAKFLDERKNANTWSNRALNMVTLNYQQFKAIGDVFLERNWEVICEEYHPAHKSIIYILINRIQKNKNNVTTSDNT